MIVIFKPTGIQLRRRRKEAVGLMSSNSHHEFHRREVAATFNCALNMLGGSSNKSFEMPRWLGKRRKFSSTPSPARTNSEESGSWTTSQPEIEQWNGKAFVLCVINSAFNASFMLMTRPSCRGICLPFRPFKLHRIWSLPGGGVEERTRGA